MPHLPFLSKVIHARAADQLAPTPAALWQLSKKEFCMRGHRGRSYLSIKTMLLTAQLAVTGAVLSFAQNSLAQVASTQPTILYGAAYYNEYTPAALQPGRLDKDIALMKAAGITVVRMGESTWSLWEPADGQFEYAWMDRVVDAMGKAGIKVILGTATYYSAWMAKAHPEILARLTWRRLRRVRYAAEYGLRQSSVPLLCRTRHHQSRPALQEQPRRHRLGSTIDGASNPDVFAGFVEHLKQKFSTTDALNKAWFLNYWVRT